MGPSIARTQWKLAQTLQSLQIGYLEEAEELERMARKFLKDKLNVEVPADPLEAEPTFNEFVFHWSK